MQAERQGRARLEEKNGEHEWLQQSVDAYRAALRFLTRQRFPLQSAATQNNLGAALQTSGSREPNTALMKQSIATYEAALEVWTRDKLPLAWAGTKNNLGNAICCCLSNRRR